MGRYLPVTRCFHVDPDVRLTVRQLDFAVR